MTAAEILRLSFISFPTLLAGPSRPTTQMLRHRQTASPLSFCRNDMDLDISKFYSKIRISEGKNKFT